MNEWVNEWMNEWMDERMNIADQIFKRSEDDYCWGLGATHSIDQSKWLMK